MMGRTRKNRKDLPQRVYVRRGAYYFVDTLGRWHPLGREFTAAMIEYAKINSQTSPITTLSGVMDRYQREVLPKKAKATQRQYLRALGLLRAVFGAMRPDDVTPPHLYGYMDRRPKIAANREIKGVLSAVYQSALRWGVASSNPCRLVERGEELPRTRYVTDHEYAAIHTIMPAAIQCAMDIAITTGLRQGDILKLKMGNWTDDGLLVRTGKTGKVLLFGRTHELTESIERCRALPSTISTLALIHTYDGQPYTSDGFRAIWGRRMRQAVADGLISERFTFHDLRAKVGSETTDDKMLGHQNPATKRRHYERAPVKVTPLTRKK